MTKNEKLAEFDRRIKLMEKMYEEEQERLKDPNYARGAELVEAAWECVFSRKNYAPDKGRKLVAEAAALHEAYSGKVEAIENYIIRKEKIGPVNIKRAINTLFVPRAEAWGFGIFNNPPREKLTSWHSEADFVKDANGFRVSIRLGSTKFGHFLGVNIFRMDEHQNVDYIECGLPHKELEYLNQNELKEVVTNLASHFEQVHESWFVKP